MVLADRGGTGERVAEALEARGARTVRVYAGEWAEEEAGGREWGRVLEEAGREGGAGLEGVAHLWSLDAAPVEELNLERLRQAQRLGSGSVLGVGKALGKAGAGGRLWVVTREAVEAGEGQGRLRGLAQAPVWGMGKVMGLEHPDRWGGLVDLGEAGGEEIERLVEELRGGDGEEEIALRGGERYVARLKRREKEGGRERKKTGRWRGEGTYLITGGTGALGLKTAEWLVERGARRLVLTGRSAAGEEAKAAMERMRKAGAEVRAERVDVADREQMGRVVEEAGKLRGVVHAAGVGGMRSLEQMSVEELEQTMRAKVEGSWVLQEVTAGQELEVFVGYSSIASVWGSKGQGHYAAGNRFVDMLAQYRRGKGQAGLSVNWGPWKGGGMASGKRGDCWGGWEWRRSSRD